MVRPLRGAPFETAHPEAMRQLDEHERAARLADGGVVGDDIATGDPASAPTLDPNLEAQVQETTAPMDISGLVGPQAQRPAGASIPQDDIALLNAEQGSQPPGGPEGDIALLNAESPQTISAADDVALLRAEQPDATDLGAGSQDASAPAARSPDTDAAAGASTPGFPAAGILSSMAEGQALPVDATKAQFKSMVVGAAKANGVSPNLAAAVASQESAWNPAAKSKAGAVGLMQLMPNTAKALGVDPTDPAQNAHGGTAYLAHLVQRYGGDEAKALAAYNAGPSKVDAAVKSGGADWLSKLPKETQGYVPAVLAKRADYKASEPDAIQGVPPGIAAQEPEPPWDPMAGVPVPPGTTDADTFAKRHPGTLGAALQNWWNSKPAPSAFGGAQSINYGVAPGGRPLAELPQDKPIPGFGDAPGAPDATPPAAAAPSASSEPAQPAPSRPQAQVQTPAPLTMPPVDAADASAQAAKDSALKVNTDEAKNLSDQADALRQGVQSADAVDAQIAQNQARRQAFQDKAMAAINKGLANVDARYVDPRAAFNQGPLQRILGGISVGLGALGSAIAGGPNVGLQAIQQGVQDQIEATKLSLQSNAQRDDAMGNYLKMGSQIFGNQDDALRMAKIGLLERAKQMVQATALKSGSQKAMDNAAALSHGLDVSMANEHAALTDNYVKSQEAKMGLQNMSDLMGAQQKLGAGGGLAPRERMLLRQHYGDSVVDAGLPSAGLLTTGKLDPDERKQLDANATARNLIQQIQATGTSRTLPLTERRKKLDTYVDGLARILPTALGGQGGRGQEMVDALKNVISEPGTFIDRWPDQAQTLTSELDAARAPILQGHGYVRVPGL